MRERVASRNKDTAHVRVQRQIRMAEVQKRKAAQKVVVSGLEDDSAVQSKAALAKCMSKAHHMKRIIFKGSFSKAPDQRRKIVERNLALAKRLDNKDPLASVLGDADGDGLMSTDHLDGSFKF